MGHKNFFCYFCPSFPVKSGKTEANTLKLKQIPWFWGVPAEITCSFQCRALSSWQSKSEQQHDVKISFTLLEGLLSCLQNPKTLLISKDLLFLHFKAHPGLDAGLGCSTVPPFLRLWALGGSVSPSCSSANSLAWDKKALICYQGWYLQFFKMWNRHHKTIKGKERISSAALMN